MDCDICIEDKSVPAEAYCLVCKQYLCQQCKTFHERVSVTKSHRLLTGDALSEADASSQASVECGSAPEEKSKCPEHRADDVEYFCVAHDAPCCEKCKRIEHRNCDLETVSDIAQTQDVQAANRSTLASVKSLLDEVTNRMQESEQGMDAFTMERSGIIEEIKSQRIKMNDAATEWEHNLLETVDTFYREKSAQTNDHNGALSDAVSTTEIMVKKLGDAIESADSEAVVVASAARKDIKKYKDMLSMLEEEKFETKMILQTKDPYRKLADCFKSTCHLTITKHKDGKTPEKVFPETCCYGNRLFREREAVEGGDILVESPTDKDTPGITGLEILPDGRTIMCDAFNLKLKLFDPNFTLLSEVELSSQPGRIDLTSMLGEIVVSLPKEQSIQLASVNSAGTVLLGVKIKLEGKSHCVHKLDNGFIVKDNSSADTLMFNVVDRSGQRIKSLQVNGVPSGFCAGNFTYTSMDASGSIFYIVNSGGGCLGFSTTTGDTVFHFKDTEMFAYRYSGVTSDPDGNIYVGESATGDIVRIDETGEKIDVLLADVKDVRFIKFISSQNTLFIKQRATNVVKTYQLL